MSNCSAIEKGSGERYFPCKFPSRIPFQCNYGMMMMMMIWVGNTSTIARKDLIFMELIAFQYVEKILLGHVSFALFFMILH